MKKILILILVSCLGMALPAQISAKLMRYMDVSADHIVFVYGGDLWLVPVSGGTAFQITHSPGEESWPKFSPDGRSIAFTANYHGNNEVYVMPSAGGIPQRITYYSGNDRVVDWHPGGEKILFASSRESGQGRVNQFFLVDRQGGMPEKLPIPYGELASFSPGGDSMAYITRITENYPFKRYRGGLSSDIILFDLNRKQAVNITDHPAIDGKPAWVDGKIYFLSDRGENMRLNIWVYDPVSHETRQQTFIDDFDVTFLSGGNKNLVFEAGGTLYLMDAETGKYDPVRVEVSNDLSAEIPRSVNVSKRISSVSASPEGKRIVCEARGELFNIPVKEGYVLNLTHSSGAFDMLPSWSPDGKHIACWSDRSGEYELYLHDPDMVKEPVRLTSRGKGFGYALYWSPDSRKIAYIDETNDISVIDTETREVKVVDNYQWNYGHGARYNYHMTWSPDSRYLAYTRGMDNSHDAIFIYDLENGTVHQVTSGFYRDMDPVFSVDGKYLYFLTDRNFSAEYSDMGDGTWIYPNSTEIAAISLTGDIPSLMCPENDSIGGEKDQEKKEVQTNGKKDPKAEKGKSKIPEVHFDPSDMESRMDILPPKPGNFGWLASFKDKIVYLRRPNTGSESRTATLVYYDLKNREEKTILTDVDQAMSTADGEKILVRVNGKYAVIKAEEKQKVEDGIPTGDLVMDLVPREEWRQIFQDTWRRHRDFFYDPQMHGVDWDALKIRYGSLIEDARTRWDVTQICSNLVAELSAGHTYIFGGDVEEVKSNPGGFLGVDWELKDGHYRISHIIRPASWDTETRSPLDRPGVEIAEGAYVLAVDGKAFDPSREPYAAFEGLSGKTVVLTVSKDGSEEASERIIVKCLTPSQEADLRYLAWIEQNRKTVDSLSDGRLGYIYMSNTSSRGQKELVQMFYGQLGKKGFIIDERFNSGGQLADRFLELLQRPVVYNLHWRHGRDHTQPVMTNTGPMGMLINGWAGSGGDGLPWAFQELRAGPIVGERTLGILVGPATGHQLIDGGGITVPGARLYDNDGHWFWEGEGVHPDIEVWDDPNLLIRGRDPQIERVVEEVLKLLESNPPEMTPAPAREDRTAKELKDL